MFPPEAPATTRWDDERVAPVALTPSMHAHGRDVSAKRSPGTTGPARAAQVRKTTASRLARGVSIRMR